MDSKKHIKRPKFFTMQGGMIGSSYSTILFQKSCLELVMSSRLRGKLRFRILGERGNNQKV